MRVTLRSSALLVIAAACGWLARGVDSPAPPVEARRAESRQSERAPAELPSPRSVAEYTPAALEPRGGRNLFAYREAPPPPAARRDATPRVYVETAEPAVATAPPMIVHAPRAFDYRFIGTFGPAADRIAAFARGGEVVTARPGDRIGDGFVLKSIGLETVEVEAEGETRRVPLGG